MRWWVVTIFPRPSWHALMHSVFRYSGRVAKDWTLIAEKRADLHAKRIEVALRKRLAASKVSVQCNLG